MIRNNKGVTIVTLVVTIVILIILATVSINALLGENGLITAAKEAKDLQLNAMEYENEGINSIYDTFNAIMDGSYSSGSTTTKGNISEKVKIGDYVNYDAGSWISEELTAATSSGGTISISTAQPITQGQFTVTANRNENSTPYKTDYTQNSDGWRVWSIDENTGVVELVHAGHSETYYHGSGYSESSTNILRNREMSMYVNSYASDAWFMTGEDAVNWYNENQIGRILYELPEYDVINNTRGTVSSGATDWYIEKYETESVNTKIDVLENGSYYWFAAPCSSASMFYANPSGKFVDDNSNYGIGARPIVSLKPGVNVQDEKVDGEWVLE